MTPPDIDKDRDPKARNVWITRAQPGASATEAHVAAIGFQPIVAPLLSFQPLDVAFTLHADEALAFTSINGVMRTAALTPERGMTVFAVGDATAAAAVQAGFSNVISAGGDVRTLRQLIGAARLEGGLLHPAADETAGDLVGALRAEGVSARKLAVYRTLSAKTLPRPIAEAFKTRDLVVLLIHSPKAGGIAAALVGRLQISMADVIVLGLSSACVEPFRNIGLRARISASAPTENALMEALSNLARDAR
jgi:uroporphyrinogen-III synthase